MLRRWTDITIALSLLVMVPSGLGLFAWHDVPQAQAASGSFLGVPYDAWSHAHLVSSIAFTLGAASHLRLNWTPLMRHFAKGASEGQREHEPSHTLIRQGKHSANP